MSMVGSDKRLNYYRLTPDEAIATLHSHEMGLTNAEAKRRTDIQLNSLTTPASPPFLIRYLQLCKPFALAVLPAALTLAAALHDFALVVALAVLLLAHVTFNVSGRRTAVPPIATLLPEQVRVIRNGQAETVRTQSVALGDIVSLQAGDVVPADLRLLDVQRFATNDTTVTGGNPHTVKFTHALHAEVPLSSRNNLAFAGTTVVTGEAQGIVIAAGEQTELGRIHLLAQTPLRRQSVTGKQLRRQQIVLLTIGLGALFFASLCATQADTADALHILLLMLTALVGATLSVLEYAWYVITKSILARKGVGVDGLNDAEALGRSDILLCNAEAFGGDQANVTGLTIGRTAYQVTGTGYEPAGHLEDEHGKRLTQKAAREISLFFETAILSHHSTVLPPDSRNSLWHVHGEAVEGALLTAARRAGLRSETVRDTHEIVSLIPYDSHRQFGGTIRHYGSNLVLFVEGAPEAVLAQSSKLWNHGHVRSLTTRDKAHFSSHHIRQSASGLNCQALAYRILPQGTNPQNLAAERLCQKLTFLGIMDVEHEAHTHLRDLLSALRGSAMRVSVLTNRPTAYAIDSTRLRQMSDEYLLERLRKGTATFTELTAEDKVRLVSVAQRARHTVAFCGASLSDLPALRQADAAISVPTIDNPWLAATTTVHLRKLTDIALGQTLSRQLTRRLPYASCIVLAGQLAALAVALLSCGGFAALHIPLAISPFQLLVLMVVLQPLAALVPFGDKGNIQPAKKSPSIRAALAYGSLAAILAYTNFLLLFVRWHISPDYIDPSHPLVAHGATLAFVTLWLCTWVDALTGVRSGTLFRRFRKGLCISYLSAALSIIFVPMLIYYPPAQVLLHTQNLNPTDWLYALLAAALYAIVCALDHHAQQHSRQAVIGLHRQKFGSSTARM